MSSINQSLATAPQRLISWGIVAILLLMPFHAFFSIFFGYLGANQALVQSWKEILILLLTLIWILFQIYRQKLAFKVDPANILFIIIVFLSLLVTIVFRTNPEVVLLGIKTNLVAIAIYFIAQIPSPAKSFLKSNILWIVLIPGLLVSFLAIAQALIIPPDLLSKLGYNPETINPRQIIDGSIDFYRSFSTLGGPNQLGAYLLVPLGFAISYGIRSKNLWVGLSSLPILAAIFLSFSRSAWIGAIIVVFLAILLSVDKKKKIIFAVASAIFLIIAAFTIFNLSTKNQYVENVLLHGRYFENRIEGSDKYRLNAVTSAVEEISKSPLGHGLGTAGPASLKSSQPVVPENWFLQIAYEIGIFGLILYVMAFSFLLGDFIRNRHKPIAASLFAITAGLLAASMFLHVWADSTLVLIMFTLYGVYKSRTQ
jgi:O-antigen ligase